MRLGLTKMRSRSARAQRVTAMSGEDRITNGRGAATMSRRTCSGRSSRARPRRSARTWRLRRVPGEVRRSRQSRKSLPPRSGVQYEVPRGSAPARDARGPRHAEGRRPRASGKRRSRAVPVPPALGGALAVGRGRGDRGDRAGQQWRVDRHARENEASVGNAPAPDHRRTGRSRRAPPSPAAPGGGSTRCGCSAAARDAQVGGRAEHERGQRRASQSTRTAGALSCLPRIGAQRGAGARPGHALRARRAGTPRAERVAAGAVHLLRASRSARLGQPPSRGPGRAT